MDDNAPAPEPSATSLVIVAAILAPVGASMLLYGLNLVTLDMMRPNRHIPRLLYSLLGLFTIACAVLAVLRAAEAPAPVVNGFGWSAIGLSFAILTVMAFDTSGSGSCFISALPIIGDIGQSACRLSLQVLVVLVDAIAIALAASWALKVLRR